jgi:hypothetical protein
LILFILINNQLSKGNSIPPLPHPHPHPHPHPYPTPHPWAVSHAQIDTDTVSPLANSQKQKWASTLAKIFKF